MKGIEYLLEAAARIKGVYPDVDFKVYGTGELFAQLVLQARQLRLNDEEIFVGAFSDRNQLAEIMAETDIFLLSSVLEGQPVVLMEAMAYGLPIVATAVGGIPELIQNGVNGLLCNPADSEDLARKLMMLIEDPALRTKLGASARLSYEKGSFQPQAVTCRFISIYEGALSEYA
jgi:glycosyltransferase involved in cell wall biosynthesis